MHDLRSSRALLRSAIAKRITTLAALAVKFKCEGLNDIQTRFLNQIKIVFTAVDNRFVATAEVEDQTSNHCFNLFELKSLMNMASWPSPSVLLRLSAALKDNIGILEKVHAEISEAYSRGVVNGYTKQPLPWHFEAEPCTVESTNSDPNLQGRGQAEDHDHQCQR